jgi:hypothetical protein
MSKEKVEFVSWPRQTREGLKRMTRAVLRSKLRAIRFESARRKLRGQRCVEQLSPKFFHFMLYEVTKVHWSHAC